MTTRAKPVKAGDTIVWTHYSAHGEGWREPFERIGEVWSQAPTGNGLSNAWWVQPDELLDGEANAAGLVVVGKSSRAKHSVTHSAEWTGDRWAYAADRPGKGELYSSGYWRDQTASLTQGAQTWQWRRRTEPDFVLRYALGEAA